MDFARKMTVTHRNVNLINLLDSLLRRHLLEVFVVFVARPHELLVLLLLLHVVALQFVVNVHVHIILLHGGEFLLDTSADVVLALLDGLHLDENVVELAGVLGVDVDVEDLEVLLNKLRPVLLLLAILVVEDLGCLEIVEQMQPDLHLEDLKVLAVLVQLDVLDLEGVVASRDGTGLHRPVLLIVHRSEAHNCSNYEADDEKIDAVVEEESKAAVQLEVEAAGIIVDVAADLNADILRRALEEDAEVVTRLFGRDSLPALARKLIKERQRSAHVELDVAGRAIKTAALNVFAHFRPHPIILEHLVELALVVNVEFVNSCCPRRAQRLLGLLLLFIAYLVLLFGAEDLPG